MVAGLGRPPTAMFGNSRNFVQTASLRVLCAPVYAIACGHPWAAGDSRSCAEVRRAGEAIACLAFFSAAKPLGSAGGSSTGSANYLEFNKSLVASNAPARARTDVAVPAARDGDANVAAFAHRRLGKC